MNPGPVEEPVGALNCSHLSSSLDDVFKASLLWWWFFFFLELDNIDYEEEGEEGKEEARQGKQSKRACGGGIGSALVTASGHPLFSPMQALSFILPPHQNRAKGPFGSRQPFLEDAFRDAQEWVVLPDTLRVPLSLSHCLLEQCLFQLCFFLRSHSVGLEFTNLSLPGLQACTAMPSLLTCLFSPRSMAWLGFVCCLSLCGMTASGTW